MRKPGAEDVRRAIRKMSKKVPRGVGEGTSVIPSASKMLCIGEAAPSVPKKPRTDKGVSSSSERGALATLGERGEAPLNESIVDLTASPSFRPKRAEVDQGAPTRPPAVAGPSDPGSSQPSGSAQVPAEVGSQGPPDAEFLREGTALGDSAMAIALFQSILLPADVEEMSQCSLTEITDSVFPALAWVSRLTLLSFFHCFLIDF